MADLVISDVLVKQWMNELAKLASRMKEDQKKYELLSHRMEAVRLLKGSNPTKQNLASTEELPRPGKPIYQMSPREVILYWLRRSPKEGVSKNYLRECIVTAGYPPEKFGRDFRYYYTLLLRLEKAGHIIRDGEKVGLKQLSESLVAV